MDYLKFRQTDLKVSKLCLGTVDFGTGLETEEAWKQLDAFTEMGGNFIDTAHVYGDWAPGQKAKSEMVIGDWLRKSGKRNHCVIATKGAHPLLDSMGVSRVTRDDIINDIEESLHALGVDTIDLYFLHRDNSKLPAGEILTVLEEERRKGKIRYYGCSNWKLSRLMEANDFADKNEISGFSCNQLMWSLADINCSKLADPSFVWMEEKTFKYHTEHQVNTMAYMSLAKGYFGRLALGEILPDPVKAIYENPANQRIAEILKCADGTITPIQASIAYFFDQPFPVVPIASFLTLKQLEEAMAGCDMNLDMGMRRQIENEKKFVHFLH